MKASYPILINIKFTIFHEDLESLQDDLKSEYGLKITKKQALKIYKDGLISRGDAFTIEPRFIGFDGLYENIDELKEFISK